MASAGRPDDAARIYGEALERDPACGEAALGRSGILLDKGMPREALECMEGADLGSMGGLAARAYRRKALIQYRLGRPHQSLECLEKSIQLDPDDADSHFNTGVIFHEMYEVSREQENLVAAARSYAEAARRRPDYTDALYNLGLTLSEMGRHHEALQAFDRCAVLRPDWADAFDSKGTELNSLGRHDEALVCYDEAIRIRPDFAAAIYNKANSMYYIGRVGAALMFLSDAVGLDPSLRDQEEIRRMLESRLEFDRKLRDGGAWREGEG